MDSEQAGLAEAITDEWKESYDWPEWARREKYKFLIHKGGEGGTAQQWQDWFDAALSKMPASFIQENMSEILKPVKQAIWSAKNLTPKSSSTGWEGDLLIGGLPCEAEFTYRSDDAAGKSVHIKVLAAYSSLWQWDQALMLKERKAKESIDAISRERDQYHLALTRADGNLMVPTARQADDLFSG